MKHLVFPALALCLAACGGPTQMAHVVIAMERDGRDDTTVMGSIMIADAGGPPAWKATHAAEIAVTAVPDFPNPLNVCRVLIGEKVRGSDLTDFVLYEVANPTIQKGANGSTFGLSPTSPVVGGGEGYTGNFAAADIPFEDNAQYVAKADGSTGPSISAQVTSPPDFVTEMIGFATPGPGVLSIPSQADLDLTWSPGSEHEMYIILDSDTSSIMCRVKDNGRFTIKKKLLQDLPRGQGRLIMERTRESEFVTDFSAQTGRQFKGMFRFSARRVWNYDLQ